MYAIASLLDSAHSDEVRAVWSMLSERFGLQQQFADPIPHLSYHVAQGYPSEHLANRLKAIGRTACPLTIRTCGLSVLFGAHGQFVTVPVVRDEALSKLHLQLWNEVHTMSDRPSDVYAPNLWFPHITLVQTEPPRCPLPAVIEALSERSFRWEFTVDEVVLINATGRKHEVEFKCALSRLRDPDQAP